MIAMVLFCRGRWRRGHRLLPLGAWFFPILGAVSCVILATQLPKTSWYRFGIWLVLGMVVYFLYGYRHSRLRRAHAPAGAPLPPDFNPEQQLPEADVHKHE